MASTSASASLADACRHLTDCGGALGGAAREALPCVDVAARTRAAAPLLPSMREIVAAIDWEPAVDRPQLLAALRLALLVLRAPEEELDRLVPAHAQHAWVGTARGVAARLLCVALRRCDELDPAAQPSAAEGEAGAPPIEYAVLRAHYDVGCALASQLIAAGSSDADSGGGGRGAGVTAATTAGRDAPSRYETAAARLSRPPPALDAGGAPRHVRPHRRRGRGGGWEGVRGLGGSRGWDGCGGLGGAGMDCDDWSDGCGGWEWGGWEGAAAAD
jgi:hypothetical protein